MRQAQLIDECLEYWKLPTFNRIAYADEKRLNEIRAISNYQQKNPKVWYTTIDYRKLLDRFDSDLANSVEKKQKNSNHKIMSNLNFQ